MTTTPSLRDLLGAGVHFGHRTARWNPKMDKFIFAQKGGIHIINLEESQKQLKEVQNYLSKAVSEGKKVLFVGTKKQAVEIVKKAAQSCDMPYVVERWPGGLLTNFDVVVASIKKMIKMRETIKSEDFEKMNKKEQSAFKFQLNKKESLYGGLASLLKKPDIVFLIDTPSQKIAIKECKEVGVPIVGLCDTNANPDVIDLPIPANDDATKSLELIINFVAGVINDHKAKEVAKVEVK